MEGYVGRVKELTEIMFCVFFSVFLFCVFFLFLSRKRCNSRKTCPGMFFCSAFFVGFFEKKTENFLKSVDIRRFCTGKREVVCKKHYNLWFFRKTSVFLKKATQRTRSKKKKHQGVFFLLRVRSPTPHSLTHSLACPWLLGGNSNLKLNLSFIKVL